MSKTHQTEIPISVTYTLPQDKIFATSPQNSISTKITGTGWALMRRYVSSYKPTLNIPLQSAYNQTIVASRLENSINAQLTSITASLPPYKSIQVKLDDKARKKIPITFDAKIRLATQHQLANPPKITPDSIDIFGPKNAIQAINEWQTELVEMNDLKENQSASIGLVNHPNMEIGFEPDEVKYQVEVEQFTEKILEIPIVITNDPDSLFLTIHPTKTKVTCRTSIKNYDRITSSQFKATADFKQVDVNNSNYVEVKLTELPDFVRNASIQPQSVEFIIGQ